MMYRENPGDYGLDDLGLEDWERAEMEAKAAKQEHIMTKPTSQLTAREKLYRARAERKAALRARARKIDAAEAQRRTDAKIKAVEDAAAKRREAALKAKALAKKEEAARQAKLSAEREADRLIIEENIRKGELAAAQREREKQELQRQRDILAKKAEQKAEKEGEPDNPFASIISFFENLFK